MNEQFARTLPLLGEEGINALSGAHVAVFGIGGVGSYCAEALARAGVGHLTFIDKDTVDITNINRQIVALHSTIGQYKAFVMAQRAKDINPDAAVDALTIYYDADSTLDLSAFDYIADAIDTVTSKLILIERANAIGVPLISAMGAGNKLRGDLFEVSDIYKTSVCPLARVMRRELRGRGIEHLNVVYSREEPAALLRTPSSLPFVPSAAGLLMAQKIITDIALNAQKK